MTDTYDYVDEDDENEAFRESLLGVLGSVTDKIQSLEAELAALKASIVAQAVGGLLVIDDSFAGQPAWIIARGLSDDALCLQEDGTFGDDAKEFATREEALAEAERLSKGE